MTLEEKISMIHGEQEPAATFQCQPGYIAGVPRLGIPSLRFADGPPGVLTRVPSSAPVSTMGLAATFSHEDAHENGAMVARQARARGIDVVLEPFINIDRDITFSRGYNTFGEDLLLTGQIGASFIRGVQDNGIMSRAKHYVAYDTAGAVLRKYVDDASGKQVQFAMADDVNGQPIPASFFSFDGQPGIGRRLRTTGAAKIVIDPQIDFPVKKAIRCRQTAPLTGTASSPCRPGANTGCIFRC